ncbi:bifunctional riboflavin kinase/FAD synthetase [Aliiglaciecola sp. CAU 1673]|uniref:bifunctional riboflavin kinase/FAD synthetase n=1 Tax=Aliiglaciecola sp. CAU 1673 TaxID=3032595 RepID=UPI0023D9DA1C|nr:bifunctional riboflavin kinase/FAD synthetase [Aliiglaciecola sp. CAU 1673]MDF2178231.1 bifunctional riboflavin kinase/FAD synthetase [Aliiglaciecola sp. CAU 1673]
MELIRGLHNIRDRHKGCVLTIGKFDGVHLGHQAVLSNLIRKARQLGLPATVMVFEPQPEEVFRPDSAPARLSRLRDKYEQLKAIGVDRLLVMRFDRRFSELSATFFVEELLVKRLGIAFLVVGDDFKFGKDRQGDFSMLRSEGQKCGFEVVSTQSFRLQDSRISSTAIRRALAESDFSLAEAMLGRPYSIAGKVVHGDKKGRELGFPTANVLLKRGRSPVTGVYAVRVDTHQGIFDGVANIGIRPTVKGQRCQLEVHLFDFAQSLYGKAIDVQLVAKIRDEMKFDSLASLQVQIAKDAQVARDLLAS